jgi:diguanylate cyclase (GGDEF)-like protein
MAITSPAPTSTRQQLLQAVQSALHHGNAPVAVTLCDLDGFGSINDRLGRAAGDAVLVTWEQVLATNLPPDAQVLRMGGDEYAVVLPGSTAENALVRLEEIRQHFSGHEITDAGEKVGVSIGIAAAPPHGNTAAELWQAAGQAVMRAKREGRGRVSMYTEENMTLKSNYYPRADLDRLARLSRATGRTEAGLLREALADLLDKFRSTQ